MEAFTEVLSQADLQALLASIAGFHDSMTKEAHLVNRAFVNPDHGMDMSHMFDLQLVVQSQWPPHGIELVFRGVRSLSVTDPGEYWGASGSVTAPAAGSPRRVIRLAFDSTLVVEAEQLLWRPRPEWLGHGTRLRGEVPAPEAVAATPIDTTWRQCSSCSEAWQAPADEIYARCPDCKEMTVLPGGAVEQRDAADGRRR